MSRRQQTIANITDQFFFDDDVYSNELSRDRRRYLNDEIAYLKLQLLYNAIMQGISHHESSDKAKRFTAVPLKLERAQKAFKILFGQDTILVPSETPLLEWKWHIFNNNKPVYYHNVEDFLDQFERVFIAHQLE